MERRELTSRKIQALKTRREIFDTAINLFERKGYENITIAEICRETGVSTGCFYHHFKSKEQVILERFLDIDDYYQQAIEDVSVQEDVMGKMRVFLADVIRYLSGLGSRFLRLAYRTQMSPGMLESDEVDERRYLHSVVTALIEEGQEKGEIRRDLESSEIARVVINCYRGITFDWCLKKGAFDMQEEGELLYGILLEGLRPKK